MRLGALIFMLCICYTAGSQFLTIGPSYLRNVQAGDTLTRGQLVYIDASSGRAYPADADDRDKKAVGIAAYSTSSSAITQVYSTGILIDSSLSLVPGKTYYLSGTAGAWTTTRQTSYGYQEAILALDTMVYKIVCGEWVPLPLSVTETIDFDAVGEDGGVVYYDVSVPGAAVDDVVVVSRPPSTIVDQVVFTAWVESADTVRIRIYNRTVSSVDFSSETYNIKVFKND